MASIDPHAESILIVDDEAHILDILQRILQHEGYLCHTAESAEEALAHLANNPCGLMLVDIHLGGINGLDLLKICRQQWPDTQVVMCSGDDKHDTVLKSLEAGAIGYLIKPFEPVEVLFNAKNALRLSHLERENRSQHQQLEQKLEQCNLDLHESYRLMVQQEKLASLGQLAAGVAHEVNNPTGYIASNLSSLRKYLKRLKTFFEAAQHSINSSSDNRMQQEVQNLRKSLKIDTILNDLDDLVDDSLAGTERIRHIVMGLKKFSRKEAEEPQSIDLNALLEETLNLCWNELKYKAEVKRQFSPLPHIWGMPQKLSQVFLNLLVNAAQAIENQGTITLATQISGDHVKVSITDTGCGIAAENLEKIFEPFFTTKSAVGGTGLGLSILQEIIGQHQGSIHVQSQPDSGTTFVVTLPAFDRRLSDNGTRSERPEV